MSTAIWEGTFKLFGIELRCCVLNDGTRVVNAEDMARLFGQMERGGDTIPMDEEELNNFARWQKGDGPDERIS